MTSSSSLIVFDGDNTLWHVEALYDEARTSLCRLVQGSTVTLDEVDRFQRARDAELHTSMGYSAARFPRSFEETAEHFLDKDDPRIALARQLAETVFSASAVPADGVDDVLARLSKSHRLALLTAGQHDVQRRRLEHFGRNHHFDAVRIVERKDEAAISALLRELGAVPALSWMVGDSLRSDIIPAVAAGMRAVHLQTMNWHVVEIAGSSLPPGALTARSLREVESLISASALPDQFKAS